MIDPAPTRSAARCRPGGRSARVRSAVLAATIELLAERGVEATDLADVARRAGVHPTTVQRRWGSRARLIGEALLERSRPLTPVPDTGSLATDLEQLLMEGVVLLRTSAVRALFELLLAPRSEQVPDLAAARDRFWAAHMREVNGIVGRAVQRGELPAGTDAASLVELLIGPVIVRVLLMDDDMADGEISALVQRVLIAFWPPGNRAATLPLDKEAVTPPGP